MISASSAPIYVFDHVAVAVPRMAETAAFVAGSLGGRPHAGGPGLGFRGAQWRFENGGKLEVLEPDGSTDSFLARFLQRRGPGVHHVTFKVPELATAADRARAMGFDIIGYDDSFPAWKEAFLHPKQAGGIVVQFAESHPELGGNWGPDWPGLPRPEGDVPGPAALLGLELEEASEERAMTLWSSLLGGAVERTEGRLIIRWPTSPMYIAMRIAPTTEPGPRALDVTADRTLDLRGAKPPEIGALIRQV